MGPCPVANAAVYTLTCWWLTCHCIGMLVAIVVPLSAWGQCPCELSLLPHAVLLHCSLDAVLTDQHAVRQW